MSNKEKIKAIRFSDDEVEYLEEKAREAKRKLSDFMRCELLKDKDITGWNKK